VIEDADDALDVFGNETKDEEALEVTHLIGR
jgi:hypothetical protein